MKKKLCLFLGYSSKKTILINFLRRKKIKVYEHGNKKLNNIAVKKYDFIISFGYKKIISKKIIDCLKRPIINLHISYLPYNRGASPNFWSFKNNTPKGITIHEINHGIDTGDIIFRKKINFKINNKTTFRETYWILRREVEKLFQKNFKKIVSGKYNKTKQGTKKKLNLKKELPKIGSWDIPISKYFS